MAINDKFTIQEINLDKKNLSFDNKFKEIEAYWNNECAEHSFDNKLEEIEAYWNNECAEHPSNNHCKIFCD